MKYLSCLLFIFTVVALSYADIYFVTNTNDAGAGSLRQAMRDVNSNAGADTIAFNLPSSDINHNPILGIWTILPDSSLPELIDDSTMIDGSTQAAYIGHDTNPLGPEIEIDGSNAGVADGFFISSSFNTIKGLVINQFREFGIEISGFQADGNTISGNYIGTDVTGTEKKGNRFSGVIIYTGPKRNVIGGRSAIDRNILSGNGWSGAEIQGESADSNSVLGNYIGTDVSGSLDLGNDWCGINVWSNAQYNSIGSTDGDAGNVISGNSLYGISIAGPETNHNTVMNNIIGMNAALTVAIPNDHGIGISGNFNIIGSLTANAGNIISGNNGAGISLGACNGNIISGNSIGTDKGGTLALPNASDGVYFENDAHDNILGPLNLICFNQWDGVKIDGQTALRNRITQNSITANRGVGIHTLNGGNAELTPPMIISYFENILSGTASANHLIEIFSDDADEGKIYLASAQADEMGNFNWTGTAPGPYITTTATDAAGNTSEFSVALRIISLEVITTADEGIGSLRWAIERANADIHPDTIRFNIPVTDPNFDGMVWKIQPSAPLPAFTGDGTFIDGHSQSINQGNTNTQGPEILLEGSLLTDNPIGLEVKSSWNTISGLIISGFEWDGIRITGAAAIHNRVTGNYIGTNAAGTDLLLNSVGISLSYGSNHNTIGGLLEMDRNVISGNRYRGIELIKVADNVIIGNFVGTDISGTMNLGNWGYGITVEDSATGNRIGGPSANERNVISGNQEAGISIIGDGTRENIVQGNYIGTDITGNVSLGNAYSGLDINTQTSANVIGGLAEGEGNLISGNGHYGILISGIGADSNRVLGNRIGTNVAGSLSLGNQMSGILLCNHVRNNRIGPRNLISGNRRSGIQIQGAETDSNTICGNWIGLEITGQDTIPNAEHGIHIEYGPRYTIIGGSSPEDRNVISGNGWYGIAIYGDSTAFILAQNNYVGSDLSGTKPLGNRDSGIQLMGFNHSFQGNLISANGESGFVSYGFTMNVQIANNLIGVQLDGLTPLPNGGSGIRIVSNASLYQIGPDNRICHNDGSGIVLLDSTVSKITVTQNAITNNRGGGILLYQGANGKMTTPIIENTSPLSGTAAANSLIEVFSDVADQGLIYEGSGYADASGAWSWAGTMTGPNMTVTATDGEGNTSAFSNRVQVTAVEKSIFDKAPDHVSLLQNYPNPFNSRTIIQFGLQKASFVTLTVYNLVGEEVARLVSKNLDAGVYRYHWDGSNKPSGIYVYRLETEEYVGMKKLLLMK